MLISATAVLPAVSGADVFNIATSGEVKDQYQEQNDECVRSTNAVPIWTEFIPTMKKLVRVEVKATQAYEESPPLTMEIHKPLGHLLPYKKLPLFDIPNTPFLISFDIPDIEMVPGDKYYIMAYYEGTGEDAYYGAGGDKYPKGDSDRGRSWDWSFSTFAGAENNPPSAPDIDGPTSGKEGKEYEYKFKSVDPEGDDIHYCIDWGDGSSEICIGPFPSGSTASARHTWTTQGTYTIKAKAKDIHDAESDWATLEVTIPKNKVSDESSPISNRPPRKPSRPVGEKRGYVGSEYRYSTSTTDPDGDDVFYLFSYGDGTNSGWNGPYASGQTVTVINKWDRRGIYLVRAKAKDKYGAESLWSDPLIIRMPMYKTTGLYVLLETVLKGDAGLFSII
jgi:hypothetical protein